MELLAWAIALYLYYFVNMNYKPGSKKWNEKQKEIDERKKFYSSSFKSLALFFIPYLVLNYFFNINFGLYLLIIFVIPVILIFSYLMLKRDK